MSAKSEQKKPLNQNEIAIRAAQIWHAEGCQVGRDLEYWLKAEEQLLKTDQPKKSKPIIAGQNRKVMAAGLITFSNQSPAIRTGQHA